MNHKRKKAPAARAGCAMCKPWKKMPSTPRAKRLPASDRRKVQP